MTCDVDVTAGTPRPRRTTAAALALAALIALVPACRRSDQTPPQLTYDKATGKLTRIAEDTNHDGIPDTWAYMDGTTLLRVEQDLDEDGKIERWVYYAPGQKVVRAAISTRKNGRPDEWWYPDSADPTKPARIDYSSTSDEQHIDRRETYDQGKLVRVELDTVGDGKMHQWEVHDGDTVVSVEFDLNHDGRPDMRETFAPDGTLVSTETEPDGHGGYKKKKDFSKVGGSVH
jgi:hypothetical protein